MKQTKVTSTLLKCGVTLLIATGAATFGSHKVFAENESVNHQDNAVKASQIEQNTNQTDTKLNIQTQKSSEIKTETTQKQDVVENNQVANKEEKPVTQSSAKADTRSSLSNDKKSEKGSEVTKTDNQTLAAVSTTKQNLNKNGQNIGTPALTESKAANPSLNISNLQKAIDQANIVEKDINSYAKISQDRVNRSLAMANALLKDPNASQSQVDVVTHLLSESMTTENLVKRTPTHHDSVPIGQTFTDTEGAPIQAHGGGFLKQIAPDGKPIYYWVGEDKSQEDSNFNGITLYSSRDLLNWTYLESPLTPSLTNKTLMNNKIERPKILYNDKTKKYVIWGHWEDQSGYDSSQVVVATSDKVDGTYTVLGHWRPGADADHRNWRQSGNTITFDDTGKTEDARQAGLNNTNIWGTTSRDFTLYQDNNKAYLITSAGQNMYIFQLNDDFTDVVPSSRYMIYNSWREAPAMIKAGKYYYLITSRQSGWAPNQATYAYTTDVSNPNSWVKATSADPKYLGNDYTFYSQSTNIMQVGTAQHPEYLYMGDRWNAHALGRSTYVWLPLTINGTHMSMSYQPDWKLNSQTNEIEISSKDVLLSQGKPATSNPSSTNIGVANDGQYTQNSTDLKTSNGDLIPNYSYTVDLQGEDHLDRIDTTYAYDNHGWQVPDYKIEVSNDNQNWTTIVDHSNNTDMIGFTSDKVNTNARYVRLDVGHSNHPWNVGRLLEFQVYGQTDKTRLQNDIDKANQVEKDIKSYSRFSQDHVNRSLSLANEILSNKNSSSYEIDTAADLLEAALNPEFLVKKHATHYDQVPVGKTWLDTEGAPIQAHGGGFLKQIDPKDGKPIYYWLGEDKSHQRDTFNGMCLYSSKDLLNWTYVGSPLVPSLDHNKVLFDNKIERPKLLYNAKTHKYVIWGHYEEASGYWTSQIIVATADKVDGPYTILGHWRPGADANHRNWRQNPSDNNVSPNDHSPYLDNGQKLADSVGTPQQGWGYDSRDFTVYVDPDTQKGYLICASDNGHTEHLFPLNDSYTDVAGPGYTLFRGQQREAPTIIKVGKYYFTFDSASSYWNPNQNGYAYTTNLDNPNGWTNIKDWGNAFGFGSQSTYVLQVGTKEHPQYIYMGDRWNWNKLGDSTYIWLPINFHNINSNNPSATINYQTDWTLGKDKTIKILSKDRLLSQGKPATSSPSSSNIGIANDGQYSDWPATIDGSKNVPYIYTVDLQKDYNLHRIDITFGRVWREGTVPDYYIETSEDGKNWTTVADSKDEGFASGFASDQINSKGRYVRLVVTSQSHQPSDYGTEYHGLAEFQVYGTDIKPVQPTKPTNPTKPTTPENPTEPVEPTTPVSPATPAQPTQATQASTVLPHGEASQVRVWEYKGAYIYNADHERVQNASMYLPGSGHNVVADEYGQPRVYHLTGFEAFKLSDGSHQGDYVDIRNFRNYGIVKTLRVSSRIYNVNGEVASPNRYIRKGTRIKIYGQFKINGRTYYRIGHNQFVLARNFKHTLAGYLTKIVKRRSRSYKTSGRVARPVRYIKKGTKIRVFGKTKIHGKVFYRMSNGRLILAKNVK